MMKKQRTSFKWFRFFRASAWFLTLVLFSFSGRQSKKATLYVIGDSTVKNGSGRGDHGLWGWGDYIAPYFDTSKINIENDARGGRSSRTFQTEGLWDKVLSRLQPGDFVIMQFGHNDGGPLDDTARARGTIKGTGEESRDIYNPIMKKQERVHSYGWYMRKYVRDAKAKGAIPIICAPIPRNMWKDGKVIRNNGDYGKWAAEVARQEGAWFIDLNAIIAAKYEALGPDKVKTFFPGDHTHTDLEGARLNAAAVIQGLRKDKHCTLNHYLSAKGKHAHV